MCSFLDDSTLEIYRESILREHAASTDVHVLCMHEIRARIFVLA